MSRGGCSSRSLSLVGGVSLSILVMMSLSSPIIAAPFVDFAYPQTGNRVSGMVWIKVDYYSDSGDPIKLIQLYVDNELTNHWALEWAPEAVRNTVSFPWNSASAAEGSHTIMAKAIDTRRNEGVAEITVDVVSFRPKPGRPSGAAEQWVYDVLQLNHAEAAKIAQMFGGGPRPA